MALVRLHQLVHVYRYRCAARVKLVLLLLGGVVVLLLLMLLESYPPLPPMTVSLQLMLVKLGGRCGRQWCRLLNLMRLLLLLLLRVMLMFTVRVCAACAVLSSG